MSLADRLVDAVGGRVDKGLYNTVTEAAEVLIESERFFFGMETKTAIAQIAHSRPSALISALPLCRLPFKKCWFEWPGDDASEGKRESPGIGEAIPRSFGVLLEALDETHQRIGVSFVWDFKRGQISIPADAINEPMVNVCPVAFIVDWSDNPWKFVSEEAQKFSRGLSPRYEKLPPAEREAAFKLMDTAIPTVAPHSRGMVDKLRKLGREDVVSQLIKAGVSDTIGELAYVIGALCLLNSKNCVELEPADLRKLNAARLKNKKHPLLSYSAVKITLSKRDQNVAATSGMSLREMRQHIVRGHFKIRSGKVFWWRPHIRGNIALGEVRRTSYEIVQ